MSPELGARACGGESWGWGARATVRDVLSCGISLCCRVCCRAAVLCVLSIVRCARTYIELESTPQAHARPPRPIANAQIRGSGGPKGKTPMLSMLGGGCCGTATGEQKRGGRG